MANLELRALTERGVEDLEQVQGRVDQRLGYALLDAG